jgi:dUTP pyrophosphatase
MKIKIKLFKDGKFPKLIRQGDWIDLYTAQDITIKGPTSGVRIRKMVNGVTTSTRPVTFNNTLIPLNVAMKLPDGCEAYLLPRSSTFNKFGIILANMQGIIDNTYQGDNDEWKFNAIALRDTFIPAGTAIAQFRIQLSQRATFLQKLKWFFSNKIEVIEVLSLAAPDRDGFGSTDKQDNN